MKQALNTMIAFLFGLATLLSAQAHAEAQLLFIHTDHLGTPQVMTDENQNVVWDKQQTPFGETVSQSDTSLQPMRFPGQYEDEETGYYYNYFRDYDPTLGRYIQSDPIGLNGGINTYAYVGGNPLIYTDPYGLEAMSAGAAWGLRGLGGVSLFVPVPGARVFGVGLIAMTIPGDTPQNMQMAGLQTTPNSIPHWREDEILGGFPGGGCDGLEAAIRDLKRTIDWRKGDLNPAERGTRNYVGHVQRIKKLQKRLDQLKREARNMGCNPDCE